MGRRRITSDKLTEWALDPTLMVREAGMEPDDIQTAFLRDRGDQILLNCTRQFGKSTITGAVSYGEAICYPGTLVLMLGPSQRQAVELFRKSMEFHMDLGQPVRTVNESVMSCEFENGSRIVSLPGKEATIRGYSSVGMLVADEGARIADQLYFSIRPMLAVTKAVKGSGGRLIGLSSPFGRIGWFHDAWNGGCFPQEDALNAGVGECSLCKFEEELVWYQERKLCKFCLRSESLWEEQRQLDDGWKRYRVLAEECPRIPIEFLEAERKAIGPYWYRQEFCCQFLDTIDSYFDSVALDRALQWDGGKLFDEQDIIPGLDIPGEGIEPLFDEGEFN